MPAHPHRGVDQPGAPQRFQAQVGYRVGQVFTGTPPPPDHHRNRQPIGHAFVDQDVIALHQQQGEFGRQPACVDVIQVEFPQDAVQVPRNDQRCPVRPLHPQVHQPGELHRLPKSLRCMVRNLPAVNRHLAQFTCSVLVMRLVSFQQVELVFCALSGIFTEACQPFQRVQEGLVHLIRRRIRVISQRQDPQAQPVDPHRQQLAQVQLAVPCLPRQLQVWVRFSQRLSRRSPFLLPILAVLARSPDQDLVLVQSETEA